MRLPFTKRDNFESDVKSHDFNSILKHASKNSGHFRNVQQAFDRLKINYHEQQPATPKKSDQKKQD